MFDVQRIWDAWPGLRHTSVSFILLLAIQHFNQHAFLFTQMLRAILRECTESETTGAQKVLNVFVVGSHVFVITGIPEDGTCKHTYWCVRMQKVQKYFV